jgi:hypothetical protein
MSRSSSLSASTPLSYDPEPAAASTGTREPLTEFKVFPKLPSELRLKIWNHALFLPRIVEVRAPERQFTLIDSFEEIEPVRPTDPPPYRLTSSLLRVCRESRQEAQKNLPFRDVGRFSVGYRLVNWDIDIFYFDFKMCLCIHSDLGVAADYCRKIRHLVLPSRIFEEHPTPYAATIICAIFTNVEDVAVIMIEGLKTSSAAELITLREATERNIELASLISSAEIDDMELRLQDFKAMVAKRWYGRPAPEFRLMAMDRVDGIKDSFRI